MKEKKAKWVPGKNRGSNHGANNPGRRKGDPIVPRRNPKFRKRKTPLIQGIDDQGKDVNPPKSK